MGHSTRTADDFLHLLKAHDIELVADVRRFPGSRRLPHFESHALAAQLAATGIAYQWLPALGGRRRSNPDSVNVGWRHPAFRAYADHLATEEFAGGLFELMLLAQGLRTAIMCAEALWWHCHRRLIADVLTTLGFTVVHIPSLGAARVHQIAPPGRIARGSLWYDHESIR